VGNRQNVMGRLANERMQMEARCLALQAKLSQRHVDAAESLVKKSIEISDASGRPLNEILGSILSVASKVQYMEWQQKQREKNDDMGSA